MIALAIALSSVASAAVNLVWNADVLPETERIHVDYDFGSDIGMITFYKKDQSYFQNPFLEAMSPITGLTGSGTLEIDVPLASGVSWTLRVMSVVNGQPINEFDIPGISTLPLLFDPSDMVPVIAGVADFSIHEQYGNGWPNNIPVLRFWLHDVTDDIWYSQDTVIHSITAHVFHFYFFPTPGHYYEYCFELHYSDAGGDPLWTNEFIASSCGNMLPYGDISTSVEASSHIMTITVSPNPVDAELHVAGVDSNVAMTVLDVNGRLVKNLPALSLSGGQYDVSDLAHGVYIVHANDGTAIGRFVKN